MLLLHIQAHHLQFLLSFKEAVSQGILILLRFTFYHYYFPSLLLHLILLPLQTNFLALSRVVLIDLLENVQDLTSIANTTVKVFHISILLSNHRMLYHQTHHLPFTHQVPDDPDDHGQKSRLISFVFIV